MSARRRHPAPPRSLRVLPRSRGGWIVTTEQDVVVSEHASATEAELAAQARLHEGDEVLLYDCYHRSRRVRVAACRSGRAQAPGTPSARSRS